MQSATERARFYVDSDKKRIERMLADSDRDRRLSVLECQWCYYRGHGLAGQAFTEYKCIACDGPDLHPNTAVPELCTTCATKYEACCRCGGDLHMRRRQKLERKK